MSKLTIVLLVILVILIIVVVALYFLGKKAEKKQAEQQQMMNAASQQVTMLIIDKGKMRLKDAGFPAVVMESTPKYLRRSKVPVVKAKVGPKIMNLMCDAAIYDLIPVKKEVKATVSGIYITAVRGLRGPLEVPKKKKKGFFARFKKDENKK
ncbi:MAG: hypothetical protein SPJ92_08660 [Bariatricus sp.]|nr:hypothetical protein [Bariatricus sp.]